MQLQPSNSAWPKSGVAVSLISNGSTFIHCFRISVHIFFLNSLRKLNLSYSAVPYILKITGLFCCLLYTFFLLKGILCAFREFLLCFWEASMRPVFSSFCFWEWVAVVKEILWLGGVPGGIWPLCRAAEPYFLMSRSLCLWMCQSSYLLHKQVALVPYCYGA